MADLKREYVVPLRRRVKLAPRWRRSKKAVAETRAFLQKHMKTDRVVICSELNEELWANGAKNPPGKVSVVAVKTTVQGTPVTLANLSSVGVDEQLKLYESQQQQASADMAQAAAGAGQQGVQDAEVSEKSEQTQDTETADEQETASSSGDESKESSQTVATEEETSEEQKAEKTTQSSAKKQTAKQDKKQEDEQ